MSIRVTSPKYRFAWGVVAFTSLLLTGSAQTAFEPSPLTLQHAVTIALEKNPARKMALGLAS